MELRGAGRDESRREHRYEEKVNIKGKKLNVESWSKSIEMATELILAILDHRNRTTRQQQEEKHLKRHSPVQRPQMQDAR